jgi:transposase
MTPASPLPDHLWNSASPELQAAILAWVQIPQQRIAELESRVHDLEARLPLDSTNSSKPPSSDPIGMKRQPPTPAPGRKRGGQPGHPKAQRILVPPEKVRLTTECKPVACRRCGQVLEGHDLTPLIHPVAELPRIEPIVDEFRLHRLVCPHGQETTCGPVPAGVGASHFGPSLQAVLTTFTGLTASASVRSRNSSATCSGWRSPRG